MPRKERKPKLRVLAAAASLLGAAAMGAALGLFSPDATGDAAAHAAFVERQRSSREQDRDPRMLPSSGRGAPPDAAAESEPTAPPPRRTEDDRRLRRGQDSAPPPRHDERRTEREEKRDEERLRELQKASPHEQLQSQASDRSHIDPSDPLKNCVLRSPKLSPSDLNTPVLAASYPGSGSRMLRHLIEALTGLATGDEYVRTTRRAVAIKTHYPHRHGTALTDVEWVRTDVRGAILLLRNPRDAVPSFGNHLYERKHGLTDHSTRAPVEEWVKWRNREFRKQLAWWRDTVVHWVERFPADRRLILTYEGLTGTRTPDDRAEDAAANNMSMGAGVASAARLAEFLSKSVEGIDVVPPSELLCVWFKVVKYDDAEHRQGGVAFHSQRSNHPEGSSRPYSRWQLEEMMDTFKRLKEKFAKEADVVEAMELYEAQVVKNLGTHDFAAQQQQQQQAQGQQQGQAEGGGEAARKK